MKRIRNLLVRELVTLVGVTVALLVATAWWGAVRAMDAQANDRARAGVEHLEREFGARLSGAQQLGDSLGALWRSGALGPEPTEAHQALFMAVAQGRMGIPNVVIAGEAEPSFTGRNQDGVWDTRVLVTVDGRERVQSAQWDAFGRVVKREITDMAPIHWRSRPWYLQARTADRGFWTAPYLFVNPPIPGISYITPIRDAQGTFQGAICVDLLLEDLSRLVKAIQPTPNTQVVISDAQGRTLTAPDLDARSSREAVFMQPLSPTYLPVIHALQADTPVTPGAAWQWPRLSVHGTSYLTHRRPFAGGQGLDWKVSVAIPTNDLLKEARWRALASLSLGVLALAWAAWRVGVLGRRFSDPLVRLAESSEALVLGHAALPPVSEIQEIQQVAEAFGSASRALLERNELEARVQHIQRLETLGTLAGGIAHDINNQLQAISGKISLALLEVPSQAPSHRQLEQAERAVLRCGDMTQSLLSFARPNRPEPRSLEVNGIVKHAGALLEHMRGRNIRTVLALTEGLPPVLGEPVQLEQVILNLGVNAKDAMPEGGTLTLATDLTPDREVRIRITDTGTGIPPEIKARMFEAFFTTKGEGKGTGLGLAMVVEIMKAHGGRVELDTEVGRGTTFSLIFPPRPT
jgi:signal transduction histidine kinase